MTWLRQLWQRLRAWWCAVDDIFDYGYPDSMPPDMDCPDTQPTSPGALDSDLSRLEQ